MDAGTSAYLASISRQLLLSSKEIETVLSLRERFPTSKKLQELAARAETERDEMERTERYSTILAPGFTGFYSKPRP